MFHRQCATEKKSSPNAKLPVLVSESGLFPLDCDLYTDRSRPKGKTAYPGRFAIIVHLSTLCSLPRERRQVNFFHQTFVET